MKIRFSTIIILLLIAVHTVPAVAGAKGVNASKVTGKFIPDTSLVNINSQIRLDKTPFYLNYETTLYYYKSLEDTKGSETESFVLNGYFQPSAIDNSFYNSMASTTLVTFTVGGDYDSTVLKIVTLDGKIYLQNPPFYDTNTKKGWYEIPKNKYKEFSKTVGLEKLMNFALVKAPDSSEKQIYEVGRAVQLNNLLQQIQSTSSELNIPGTYQDFYLFNQKLVPQYLENLSKEGIPSILLALDGVKKSLKNKDNLTYFVENSYYTVWIDKKAGDNVGMVWRYTFKDPKSSQGFYIYKTTVELRKPMSPQKIATPQDVASFTEMQKAFGVTLVSDIVDSSIIDVQKENLKKAKTNEEKAFQNVVLAELYMMLESYTEASEYYRKSASYYPKNSVDYYNAIAQAELAIGNGKGAKEYFELGFKKDSYDFILLKNFGSFLTGLSLTSSPYQDVPRALELSTAWSEDIPDDSNLITQFVSYIMLGMDTDTSKLKSKFKRFGTPENYNLIARAYHRLGNEKKVKEFQQLAKKAGYVSGKKDETFFAFKFEPLNTESFDADYAEIRRYENLLKTEKNQDEKAELNYNIASEYEALDQLAKAAEYYNAAATLYPSGSSDKFEALAEAYWMRGEGVKAKESFELALKADPTDYYVLTNYGMFLLGLTTASAPHRDAQRVLTLNQKLLKDQDDTVLLNQYLAFILTGKEEEAESLVKKFKDFEYGSNYMYSALAYHAIGNVKKSKNLLKLMKKSGYELTMGEKEFLGL